MKQRREAAIEAAREAAFQEGLAAAIAATAEPEGVASGLNAEPSASEVKPAPQDPRERMGKDPSLFDNHEDGLETAATIKRPDDSKTAEDNGDETFMPDPDEKIRAIEAIKAENHSPRQLRIIRRVAEVQNVRFDDEYEALWKLRQMGIDPFKPGQTAEMIRAEAAASRELGRIDPQAKTSLPSTELREEEIRISDIRTIQLDIARRRRRKIAMLYARLGMFVFLPTLLAFFYFRDVAARFYETETQFVIQIAGTPGATPAAMGANPLLTAPDAMNVQAYLLSREAMLRLDRELGFRAHFSQPQIDRLQRIEMDATQEETFKLYKRMIKIGFDPTEGIVKMFVNANDPETSEAFSNALLRYAEEQVDFLTARLREDQMKGAREIYAEAEQKMLDSQLHLIELQKQLGTINPDAQGEAVSGRIATYEDEIQTKKLELASILDNPRPNQARVDGVKTDIARLEAVLAELRAQISTGTETGESLADLNSRVRLAQLDLQTRQGMLQQSLQNLERARIEADQQVRYLQVNVAPIAPDVPTYPRVTENTIISFLIIMGIYLMISVTVAILREQVSA